MAPAHQSWIRENLTLVLFAVAVIAGFTVVGIDVANHNGPTPRVRAGAGSSDASATAVADIFSGDKVDTRTGLMAFTTEQIKLGYTRPGLQTGRGGPDWTLYTSIGTHYCAHYYKYTVHDSLTTHYPDEWSWHEEAIAQAPLRRKTMPHTYEACQGACDAIPTCNAFGLGKDKCATYEGCISSAPKKQNLGDYFFMNTRN